MIHDVRQIFTRLNRTDTVLQHQIDMTVSRMHTYFFPVNTHTYIRILLYLQLDFRYSA